MIDFLSPAVPFLLAGVGVLAAGVYVLATGVSTRRRLSFIQVSLSIGLWAVVLGTLVSATRNPESLRAAGDLFLFLGVLVATTAYQFVTHGLDFGTETSEEGGRRRGVIAMWGIATAVALFLASGHLRLVEAVRAVGGAPVFDLHWHAVLALATIAAGLAGALIAAARTWRSSPVARRASQAAWTMAGLVTLAVVPLALVFPLLGAWGPAAAGVATLAGTAMLALVARAEPVTRHDVKPPVKAVLHTLGGPAIAVDREGEIQDANAAFLEAFEHDLRVLVGEKLGRVVREVDGSEIPLSSLSLDVKHEGREVRLRTGDDRPVPARSLALQLGHVDGEALATILLFDVPSLDRRTRSRPGALDRWLGEVFRPEVPALTVYDLESGRFTAVNDQLLQLIGYAQQETIGRSASELDLPSDGYRWSSFLERIRDEGRAEPTELDLNRGDGDRRHVECSGVLLSRSQGDDRRALLLFRDVTAIKEAERKLRGQSLYDSLTGLPMPALFQEHLKHALDRANRYKHRVAVLLVDLEDLKPIRDEYGDDARDQVLSGVAWRLYECFRQMDTLCRRGEDQFMVLLEDLDEAKGAATAADRFRGFMEDPFELESGQSIRVRSTVGIAVSVPGQTEAEDLVEWADVAIFRAKRRGESPIRIYDPERDAGDMERLTRADRLRQAIDRGELALRYQPLIDLVDQRIIGAEALIRWPQPSGEVLTPAEFLPLAEETGLIIPLSDWVFESAIEQAYAWQKLDPDFEMSVNVAAQHFREPSLAATWERLLARVPVPADSIQLEITESFALRDDRAIHRLRDLGLRVAVDDFGTGYSSLAYLRELAVDVVKVDRAFVMDVDEDHRDQAIVRAVLLMADAFELEVTAEGIETEDQLRWLTEAGCHVGQGFYFAHPLVPSDFEKLLRSGLSAHRLGVERSPRSDEPREPDLDGDGDGEPELQYPRRAEWPPREEGHEQGHEQGRRWGGGEGWMGG